MTRIYPSKLLLFGEYAVLCGGDGLAIPYPAFHAEWIINGDAEFKSIITPYLQWLAENNFTSELQLDILKKNIDEGLILDSNIPVGYGVGSSGALVAAIYDRYANHKNRDTIIPELKKFLGAMEGYFHGQSSGLDPLVCYLEKTIYTSGENTKTVDVIPSINKYTFYLKDTGTTRSTEKLVSIFRNKMTQPDFREKLNLYVTISNACIQSFLHNDALQFRNHLINLSAFQLSHFGFAIPETIRENWQDDLESGKRTWKLCGAGGGGFMICFEENLQ